MRWAQSRSPEPPRRGSAGIQDEHVIGGRQVQSLAAGLKTNQEQRAGRILLKAANLVSPFPGATIQVLITELPMVQLLPNNRQETGELRKHQRLVPLGCDFLQLLQQYVPARPGLARLCDDRAARDGTLLGGGGVVLPRRESSIVSAPVAALSRPTAVDSSFSVRRIVFALSATIRSTASVRSFPATPAVLASLVRRNT